MEIKRFKVTIDRVKAFSIRTRFQELDALRGQTLAHLQRGDEKKAQSCYKKAKALERRCLRMSI